MARYEFKLPDIGEGIAEAEIVAWHVKVGDTVKEDQQLADMMTDKATVEMESPVSGRVIEVAGEVGDQIPIGSVLVVIETEGEGTATASATDQDGQETSGGERTDTVAFTDGLVAPTAGMEESVPSTAEKAESAPSKNSFVPSEVETTPQAQPRADSGEGLGSARQGPSTSLGAGSNAKSVLASPAV
ncbi:MAG TPA: biotin/lipoyl-containing protein, partial [Allosphingosinicella sp.]